MRSLIGDEIFRNPDEIEVGPDAMSLDLLQAVYRDPTQQLSTRIRCAMACLPFETPKLLATAIVNERDFATLLDQRLKRIADQQKVIEAQPNPDATNADPEPDVAKPPTQPDPLLRVYSNRRWPKQFNR